MTEVITFDELKDGIDSETDDNKFRICAQFLLNAIHDWPAGVNDPKNLLEELRKEINGPLTFDNLTVYSNRLGFNVGRNAWKMEALSSILEMFDFDRQAIFDKANTLETIVEKLTTHYRSVQ